MPIFSKYLKYFLLFVFILVLVFLNSQAVSQESQISPQEERKALEKELERLEKELLKIEKEIQKTEAEKKTLQNQIHILKKKIKKLDIQIEQSNLMIKEISFEIQATEASVEETSLKIDDFQQKLINILRSIWEEDQKSLIEILLSERTISGFFDNLAALDTLHIKQKELLTEIKNLKSYLEAQKQKLDLEKTNLEKVLKIQLLQKNEDEKTKKEKDYFLKLTEVQYQKYLQEKKATEKKAAEIRAKIWELIGVREAPTYEQAIDVANWVSKLTGIRPAFLLGILTQESRIGKNIGSCYLKNFQTGMGIKFKTNRKWPRVMKPDWIGDFLAIIKELNQKKGLKLNPTATPVSCWIPACYKGGKITTDPAKVLVDFEGNITCPSGYRPFGWGGAMGPAQLMPFNWWGSNNYKAKIEAITGRVADPWDFRDSSLGAALHLKDCGAENSEREAAACYFGGWGNRNNSYHLRVYADPVMALTQCHQQFIETGLMSAWCEEKIF